MSESVKILDAILPCLQGRTVLDLGCGREKIVPWAIGVDGGTEWHAGEISPDIQAELDPTGCANPIHLALKDRTFDVVFSSHTLEHMYSPVLEVLRYWLIPVRIGGHLILYLPDERFYVFDPSEPRRRNPAHRHLLTYETMSWYADQLALDGAAAIEHHELRVTGNEYSSLWILRKLR